MRYLVSLNGKQFEVSVDLLDGTQTQAAPVAPAVQYVQPVAQPAPVVVAAPPVAPVAAPAPVAAASVAPASTDEIVKCPMPGNIWEVCVTVGQQVAEGQNLVILEAMKMENEIVSPRAGIVKQVLVTKGATVGSDDVLVVLS